MKAYREKPLWLLGGGSGIGKAIAGKVISAGGLAIIVGRNIEKLEKTVKELGSSCFCCVFDVQNADGGADLFYDAETVLGHEINGLVNNAGIYIDKDPLDFTAEDFDAVINTNLRAPVFMTIGYLKYCRDRGICGNVVMNASNRGLFGDYGPYGISKKGMIHYTQGIAREMIGTGIRVNAVAPGMTASEINGIDVNGNMYTSSAKGKRVLLPVEIAEVVWFLLSDYSKCINGAIIPCDEGDFLR